MGREDHDHDRLGTADLVAGIEQRRAEQMPPMQQQGQDWQQQQPQPQLQQVETMQQRHEHGGMQQQPQHGGMPADQQLAALFPPEIAGQFRQRWDTVQISFVDDPQQAVRQADELVAEVMKHLAASFADQRARLESDLGHGQQANTEHLRMALRGYRSFFQRLLSL